MEKQYLEIKKVDDQNTVAQILFENGYTVKKSVVHKGSSKQRVTVLEYWREEK